MISFHEWRVAELRGAAAARLLHDRLGLRAALRGGDRPIDVFAAIHAQGRTLLFQPLKSILGAYITYRGTNGLIVTTLRDLHIQRFTAAHELGHAELDHPTSSLDEHVGFAARGPVPSKAPRPQNIHEVEADAFAAEFLLPRWLIAAHVRRHHWTTQDLATADVVYQLSLRLGASYSATCWALASNSILPKANVEELLRIQPKKSKERALHGFKPKTWHDTDIWLLTEHDEGARILGDPHDRLVVRLQEHAASGYLWQMDEPQVPGLTIERDERATPKVDGEDVVGSPVTRTLVVTGEARSRLTLKERRPWDDESPTLNTFAIDLELLGPEPAGLPRALRRLRS